MLHLDSHSPHGLPSNGPTTARRSPLARLSLRLATLVVVATFAPLLIAARTEQPADKLPNELEGIDIVEQLGKPLATDLTFTRHTGEKITLKDALGSGPALLTLNYFACPMLCTLQLNGLVKGLKELGWRPGEKFRIVTVSINPAETAELASQKRDAYVNLLGIENAEWEFLTTSDQATITAIAENTGFKYRYDQASGEYAHPAMAAFISPQRVITRYLYGLEYRPLDLRLALTEAGDGKIGTAVDHLVLSCFRYDAESSNYTPFAVGIMRLGAGATVIVLGMTLLVFWRRERLRRREEVLT